MKRFVCIHGHFYQPPRENAWLETIETQDSARPFHDWNQRINAECYAPNADSRILDAEDRIVSIVNNYERISFNFGPTLLSWLQQHDTGTYAAILEADRRSVERCGGHGAAMAQAWGHAIVPLCNPRDRRTQIAWGVRDFELRFRREPEGMWLPETAVDLPTLEGLAASGIRFTVLSPAQARAVRSLRDSSRWRPVDERKLDTRRPYRLRLPSGRAITLFFYDGELSRGVAFERMLSDGARFAERLLGAFDDAADADVPQLVHLATDGETYGHHHAFGNMALAFALRSIERQRDVRLTHYAEFLSLAPPQDEVRIHENTAWSCAHGLGRWTRDCGCRIGGNDWRQHWREPLRQALDWLRDTLAPRFEDHGRRLLHDPWAARDGYIDVVLDRSDDTRRRFLERHAHPALDPEARVEVFRLMELQRHAVLMYTSCGWFFDEVSGLESGQILQYAVRAAELAQELWGDAWVEPFLQRLEGVPSNLPEYGNARRFFEQRIAGEPVTLARVAANVASGLVIEPAEPAEVAARYPAYQIDTQQVQRESAGDARLASGRLRVASRATLEAATLDFALLHPGGPRLICGVTPADDPAAAAAWQQDLPALLEREGADTVEAMIRQRCPDGLYAVASLFRDEQRRVLQAILSRTVRDVERSYRELYRHHAPLMRQLTRLHASQPRALRMAAELVLNSSLQRQLESERPDPDEIDALLTEAHDNGIELDRPRLAYAASAAATRAVLRLSPGSPEMDSALRLLESLRRLPFPVDLRRAENVGYGVLHGAYPEARRRADAGDADAATTAITLERLAHALRLALPA